MSTYAADFSSNFFKYLYANTGFRQVNFTSTKKLEEIISTLKSFNLKENILHPLFKVVKTIIGSKPGENIASCLMNTFVDILYMIVEVFRKHRVAAAALLVADFFGSLIINVLVMLVYYFIDHISFEGLRYLKDYIKEKLKNCFVIPIQY